MTIIHPIAATASDIVLALTDNDLSGFSVSPNWTFFPFMSLVSMTHSPLQCTSLLFWL